MLEKARTFNLRDVRVAATSVSPGLVGCLIALQVVYKNVNEWNSDFKNTVDAL